MNLGKILLSASMIAFVGAAAFTGTGAFFSDTETSTGNTFTAGAIDLKIDNHAWYNGLECQNDGQGNFTWQDPGSNAENDPYLTSLIDQPCQSSWELKDLEEGDLFFNLTDLKPGDWEEDTISFHVENNDAWLCANLRATSDDDMSSTEPELESGDDEEDVQDSWDGELGQELNFIFWADDGDNVLENDETVVLEGTPSSLDGYGANGNGGETFPLVDSTYNVWQNGAPNTPLPAGNEAVYIAKGFCFGNIETTPVTQGNDNSPAVNPGFTCDGASVTNQSQTDKLMGDLRFYAVQSRNNDQFVCSGDLFPDEGEQNPFRVTEGEAPFADEAEAVRFKSFGNTGSNELYLGISDLGVGANRVETGFTWTLSPDTYSVAFSYDSGDDKLVASIGATDLEYPSFLANVGSISSCPVGNLDLMNIAVIGRDDGTTVNLNNVILNGFALGNFSAVGDSNEWNNWTVAGGDFSTDFSLSGDVELTGGLFDGGDEKSKIQITVGCSSTV